jgi:hypothetical protein
MTKVHTIRYLVTDGKGHFLVDFWNGKPTWSVAAHEAALTGHWWPDLVSAKAKCLEVQKLLGQPLRLALVDFCRVNGKWEAVNQQGVVA